MTSVTDRLTATDVRVRFGGVTALDGVSVSVRPGEIVGLLGPNGAGKTTLFNVVLGSVRVASGHVVYEGVDTTGFSPIRMFNRGVVRTFQIPEIVTEMTVLDNVLLGCQRTSRTNPLLQALRLPIYTKRERLARAQALNALEAIGLREHAYVLAGRLPLGQVRLLELARCMVASPKLALLDEIASGLTVNEIAPLGPVLRQLVKESAASVLLIEHNVAWALDVADRIYVLDSGRLLMHGSPEEVRKDPRVIAAYLGSRHVRA